MTHQIFYEVTFTLVQCSNTSAGFIYLSLLTWPPWGLLWSVMKHLEESKWVSSSPVKLNHTLRETNDLYSIFLSFKITGCFSCWLETGLHVNKLCKNFKCTVWKAQVCEQMCCVWGWKHIKPVLLLWPQIRAVNVTKSKIDDGHRTNVLCPKYVALIVVSTQFSLFFLSLRLKMEGSY